MDLAPRSEEALSSARAAWPVPWLPPRELYFTSCGSESNNLALLGAAHTRTFRQRDPCVRV